MKIDGKTTFMKRTRFDLTFVKCLKFAWKVCEIMEQELRQRRVPKGENNTVYNSNGEKVHSKGKFV